MPEPFSDQYEGGQVIPDFLKVEVDKHPSVDLNEDIISIQFIENLVGCKLLEVSVNNWGQINTSDFGYKYSGGEKDFIYIGASIRLYCGDLDLSVGKITTLAPSFSKDGPPILMFVVNAKCQRSPGRPMAFNLSYGKGLIEFYPILQKTVNSDGHEIQATGTVLKLAPCLRAGVKLNIKGVGTIFDGVYTVTESKHIFDHTFGYQTRFACVRSIS
jgi:hypothetical protein